MNDLHYLQIINNIKRCIIHQNAKCLLLVPDAADMRQMQIMLKQVLPSSQHPDIFIVDNIYREYTSDKPPMQHILQLVMANFAHKINSDDDLQFFVEQLQLFNKFLLYYDVEGILNHSNLEISTRIQSNNLAKILPHLPNAKNHTHLKVWAKYAMQNYDQIFHFAPYGCWNFLQQKLCDAFNPSDKYHLTSQMPEVAQHISVASQYNFISSCGMAKAACKVVKQLGGESITIIADDKYLYQAIAKYLNSPDFNLPYFANQSLNDYGIIKLALKFADLVFTNDESTQITNYFSIITHSNFAYYLDDHLYLAAEFHGKSIDASSFAQFLSSMPQSFKNFNEEICKVQDAVSQPQLDYQIILGMWHDFLHKFVNTQNANEAKILAEWQKHYSGFKIGTIKPQNMMYILNFAAKSRPEEGDEALNCNISVHLTTSKNLRNIHTQNLLIANLEPGNIIDSYLAKLIPNKYKTNLLECFHHSLQQQRVIIFNNQQFFTDQITYEFLHLKPQKHIEYTDDTKPQTCINTAPYSFALPKEYAPKTLYATSLAKLLCDSFTFYVEEVLKLKPLEPFGKVAMRKNFGIMCHEMLYNLLQNPCDFNSLSADIAAEFRQNTQKLLTLEMQVMALAKAPTIAKNVLENVNFNTEAKLEHTINNKIQLPKASINLKARADRIEFDADQTTIIDYKTGTLPAALSIKNFTAPQLLIEAFILWSGTEVAKQKSYYIKLIKINSLEKAVVNLKVNHLLPEFELFLHENITNYLIERTQEFAPN